jgi:hypothetical protein
MRNEIKRMVEASTATPKRKSVTMTASDNKTIQSQLVAGINAIKDSDTYDDHLKSIGSTPAQRIDGVVGQQMGQYQMRVIALEGARTLANDPKTAPDKVKKAAEFYKKYSANNPKSNAKVAPEQTVRENIRKRILKILKGNK